LICFELSVWLIEFPGSHIPNIAKIVQMNKIGEQLGTSGPALVNYELDVCVSFFSDAKSQRVNSKTCPRNGLINYTVCGMPTGVPTFELHFGQSATQQQASINPEARIMMTDDS